LSKGKQRIALTSGFSAIESDPISRDEAQSVTKKTTDERRSHGALCMCTSHDMLHGI